ncbi:nucleolar protein 6 [Danaus plexippus]|uniref:nucleolar protein 6 n=1 Tax=Danaus plexippus TaxID=13037 RepID=UPI002AB22441|nr:nucleolar protein 6 [Danaus plexippus]
MVLLEMRNSVSEDDTESNILNENGKRPKDSDGQAKKRIKTKSLYRQPTANELNRLQETEQLFNSNLFRLQVEEVLEEVKVKEKTTKRFTEWFNNLKTYLLSITNDETEYDLSEKSFEDKLKIHIPLCREIQKTKVIFKFHKFQDVYVVGSYALGCGIKSKLIVDLQISVPAETYAKNDSINYKYHLKRAAYLAYIASYLGKYECIDEINYSYLNSETKPIITMKPSGKLGKAITVNLDLVCEAEAYKLHRFAPDRNNLRESWLLGNDKKDTNETLTPTPYYNSSVLRDLTANVNQEFLKQIILNSENLKQAIVLLKIWVRQRKLKVSGYIISMLVAYFVQNKRVNNIMSSYQIVRNIWIALKSSEWDVKGITLCKENSSLDDFHNHFPVVFLDRTGRYNILWELCKGTYYALRRESCLAIEILDNVKINSFIPLFMKPVTPLIQFDHIIGFRDLKIVKDAVISRAANTLKVNYGLDHLMMVANILYDLLMKGLGQRVDLVLQLVDHEFSWPINNVMESAKKNGYKERLSFGLILNPELVSSTVDRGPSADLPEAEQFRDFWGEKSELRRFQDGSITEACVWDGQGTVPKQIVDYLMKVKYDVFPVFHWSRLLSSLVPASSSSAAVRSSAAVLRSHLADLELPLDISSVQGVSAVFSSTEPAPPERRGERNPRRRGDSCLIKDQGDFRLPPYVPANRMVIELSHSGKWPGDIEAFRCLKAAFHLQIAEKLKSQFNLPTHARPEHLDVLQDGLVFRLRIAHAKEITLLRRELVRGVVTFRETDESIQLYCDTVIMPKLRGALHGLDRRYSAFAPTACLFKRWLSAHLLQVPGAVAELMVARTFLEPAPLVPPRDYDTGLYRVLNLLVEHDWGKDPLVVDFNGDMTREELSELETKYREISPRPHVFIVTPFDGECPGACSGGLAPEVTSRAVSLARAALEHVEEALQLMKDDLLGLFIPSLVGYDVIIHLVPSLVPRYSSRVGAGRPPPAHDDPGSAELIPVVEFNPVEFYLEELRSAYDEFAVFFNDPYGGDVIAVLWRPSVEDGRHLEVLNANALRPAAGGTETPYRVNLDAIVEDFKILGRGLVKEVVVNKN